MAAAFTTPSLSLLVKLGSIAVHTEELIRPGGSKIFDEAAIETLLQDPEVIAWREQMDAAALLPKKRNK